MVFRVVDVHRYPDAPEFLQTARPGDSEGILFVRNLGDLTLQPVGDAISDDE